MPNIKNLPDYPQPYGSRNTAVYEVTGNSNYQQPGDTFNASQIGWGAFDVAHGGFSYSGNYFIRPFYPANAVGPSSNVNIKWLFANGTEAANNANLSGEKARIQVFGG